MGYFFSTPVWGQNHVELFLTVGLPSLLAEGNLPSLGTVKGSRYFIYTLAEDKARLTDSDAFRQLERLMPVHVELLTPPIDVPHHVMSQSHADTLHRAEEANAATVFLPPDCIWAKNSLVNLRRHDEAGVSVVHMTGVRLNRDTALPQLRERKGDSPDLSIGAQDLTAFGLQHLHPIALSHFWNEHEGGLLPANLYWTVPDEGLVIRCYHLHPLMVRPQIKGSKFTSTIDDDLALSVCPDVSRDYVVADSDEILAFELSTPTHQAGAPFPKGRIESISAWAEIGTNRRHRQLAQHTIRMHSRPMTPAIWQQVEQEAENVMSAAQRINDRWTPILAITNPMVLVWRGYAMSLGRGAYLGKKSYSMDLLRRILSNRVPWAKALSFKFSR